MTNDGLSLCTSHFPFSPLDSALCCRLCFPLKGATVNGASAFADISNQLFSSLNHRRENSSESQPPAIDCLSNPKSHQLPTTLFLFQLVTLMDEQESSFSNVHSRPSSEARPVIRTRNSFESNRRSEFRRPFLIHLGDVVLYTYSVLLFLLPTEP